MNSAPCGSRIRVVRVHSVSSGVRTCAPSRSAAAAVWSRSATVNETGQRDDSLGPAGATQAIASSKPGGTNTLDCRALMSGWTVAEVVTVFGPADHHREPQVVCLPAECVLVERNGCPGVSRVEIAEIPTPQLIDHLRP